MSRRRSPRTLGGESRGRADGKTFKLRGRAGGHGVARVGDEPQSRARGPACGCRGAPRGGLTRRNGAVVCQLSTRASSLPVGVLHAPSFAGSGEATGSMPRRARYARRLAARARKGAVNLQWRLDPGRRGGCGHGPRRQRRVHDVRATLPSATVGRTLPIRLAQNVRARPARPPLRGRHAQEPWSIGEVALEIRAESAISRICEGNDVVIRLLKERRASATPRRADSVGESASSG